MEEEVFRTLTFGCKFDRKRFKDDIELFENKHQAPLIANNDDEEGLQNHDQSNNIPKSAKRKRKDAGDEDEDATPDTGISLFSTDNKIDQEAEPEDYFEETPAVQTKDPFEEANVLRKTLKIKVSGSAPPAPLRSFLDLQSRYKASTHLLKNLVAGGFKEPTPIQRQAASALLDRRELLSVAPTGSGKTLAFLIPLVIHVRALKLAHPDEPGIKAIVLSPTKELSMQTGRVLKPLLPGLKLRCSVLSKATAAGTDFNKVDILLANPLRLGAMHEEGKISLDNVRTLVLDEADKLFDMGFTEQVDTVIAACKHTDIVRALFSATLPETVETLARSVLKDPLRITVGERNTAVSAVSQRLLFVGREQGKLMALRQLVSQGLKPPVLVFVATKDRAKELHRELMFDGVHVDSIHADQSQAARQSAIDNFRMGKTWMLVATDLIGRGMDFVGINTVINYDFPNSTLDYIHRVGRAGRAGCSGDAVTFFTEDDSGQLRSIANVIKAAGGEVPDWMLLLKKDKRRKKTPLPQLTDNPTPKKIFKGKGREGKGAQGPKGGGEKGQGGNRVHGGAAQPKTNGNKKEAIKPVKQMKKSSAAAKKSSKPKA